MCPSPMYNHVTGTAVTRFGAPFFSAYAHQQPTYKPGGTATFVMWLTGSEEAASVGPLADTVTP